MHVSFITLGSYHGGQVGFYFAAGPSRGLLKSTVSSVMVADLNTLHGEKINKSEQGGHVISSDTTHTTVFWTRLCIYKFTSPTCTCRNLHGWMKKFAKRCRQLENGYRIQGSANNTYQTSTASEETHKLRIVNNWKILMSSVFTRRDSTSRKRSGRRIDLTDLIGRVKSDNAIIRVTSSIHCCGNIGRA